MNERSTDFDEAVALHESAHAVTAELLRPGSVLGVYMDKPATLENNTVDHASIAHVHFTLWAYDLDLVTVVAAGREGHFLSNYPPQDSFWRGDDEQIASIVSWFNKMKNWESKGRTRAAKIVKREETTIRLMADHLIHRRELDGDQVREIIKEKAPYGAER